MFQVKTLNNSCRGYAEKKTDDLYDYIYVSLYTGAKKILYSHKIEPI